MRKRSGESERLMRGEKEREGKREGSGRGRERSFFSFSDTFFPKQKSECCFRQLLRNPYRFPLSYLKKLQFLNPPRKEDYTLFPLFKRFKEMFSNR